jgi:sulfur carrier protein
LNSSITAARGKLPSAKTHLLHFDLSFFVPPMLEFTLNGEVRQLDDDSFSVADLLLRLSYAGKRIAVEQNGLIVPKSRHADTRIASGDRIEIVVAVGGG